MSSLAAAIVAIYRALHPRRDTGRGSSAWFIRELETRGGVSISKATMHNWLKDGVPEDRLDDFEAVLLSLHAEAHDRVASQLHELEEVIDGAGTHQ